MVKKTFIALAVTPLIPMVAILYAAYVTAVAFATLPAMLLDSSLEMQVPKPILLDWLTAQVN